MSTVLMLQLVFFHVRGDDKPAVLLHLLRSVVKPQDQTVVFVATKHHTEYLREVRSGIWGCPYGVCSSGRSLLGSVSLFHWVEGEIWECGIMEVLHTFTPPGEEGPQWDLEVRVATLESLALSLC